VNDNIDHIALDALSPQNIVAVGSYLGKGTNLRIYKSTDAGQTWSQRQFAGQANTSYYPQHLETDPVNSRKLTLAGYSYNSQGGTTTISFFECRTTDGGETWTVATYPNMTPGLFYVQCSATDPADSRIRFAGGYVNVSGLSSGKLFRTLDDGVNWTDITGTVLQGFVYDLHVDRTNSNKIFAATGAGVYVSTDKGSTWLATPIYAYGNMICCDPRSSSVLFVYGRGTTVYRSSDGGTSWESLKGTLSGGACTALVPSSLVSGTIYASTQSGFFRSVNAGQAWTVANKGLMGSAQVPVLKCVPSAPTSMYMSFMYSGFYKTTNTLAKPTSAGIDWQKMPEYSYCEGIMHMEVHPTNRDIIYIQEGAG
jgi:photosystem II stability/assembly factor-like uncharacterized protein